MDDIGDRQSIASIISLDSRSSNDDGVSRPTLPCRTGHGKLWSLRFAALALMLMGTLSLAWRPLFIASARHSTRLFHLKIRGRGIPYVETFEEQTTRELWESNPFSTAKSIVDTILQESHELRDGPLLTRVDTVDHASQSSGWEAMFDSLYHANPSLNRYKSLAAQKVTKDRRHHFLLELAYRGEDFCGWQTQPNNDELPSVQETLEEWLQCLEGNEVDVRVCGRTDAGVNAMGQVARYRSYKSDLTEKDVEDHLAKIPLPNNSLRCLQVVSVTKSFHPSFGAASRAYVYLIDMEHWSQMDAARVARNIHTQLEALQGRALDFIALSYGRLKTQTSICTLHHAQAHLVQECQTGKYAICIELVGDRFLRRMVRMIVENSLRIGVRQMAQPKSALLEHLESRDRNRSGNAAPPDGLIFVGATFENETWPS